MKSASKRKIYGGLNHIAESGNSTQEIKNEEEAASPLQGDVDGAYDMGAEGPDADYNSDEEDVKDVLIGTSKEDMKNVIIGASKVAAAALAVKASIGKSGTPSKSCLAVLNREIRNALERQIVDVLNYGDLDALLSLHGVGPKRAGYIQEYRAEQPFEEISDLQEIGMSAKQVAAVSKKMVNAQLQS